MGFLDAGKTCVFSQVEAKVTKNGEPVKGAKVIRRWEWNKPNQDETTTDENGRFQLPAVFEKSVSRLLPVELVIGQGMAIVVDGEEVGFWSNGKREPEENSEYGGEPMVLVCELTDEEELIEDYGSLMVTQCKLETRK